MTKEELDIIEHATGRNYNPRRVRNYFLAGKDSKETIMTDAETIEAARRLYANDTPGDKLARRLIKIAENSANWSALREKDKEISTLKAQRDELWNQITPLKDAVLYARAQRRPMGIGQDFPRAPACVSIQLGAAYGRERDCVGFWIESDEIAPTDADSPSPCRRIALALIRLAYDVAEKVKPQK